KGNASVIPLGTGVAGASGRPGGLLPDRRHPRRRDPRAAGGDEPREPQRLPQLRAFARTQADRPRDQGGPGGEAHAATACPGSVLMNLRQVVLDHPITAQGDFYFNEYTARTLLSALHDLLKAELKDGPVEFSTHPYN